MTCVHGGLLLVVLLGCLQTATAGVTCHGQSYSVSDDDIYQDCYVNKGMGDIVPSVSRDHTHNYTFAVILQDLNILCSNQETVNQSIVCYWSDFTQCMPDSLKVLYPKPASAGKILDTICKATNSTNRDCVNKKSKDMYQCGLQKRIELYNSRKDLPDHSSDLSTADAYCLVVPLDDECVRIELKSCGCSTVKAYQTAVLEFLNPPVCGASTQPRVRCNEVNPELFEADGGQRHTGWAVSVLVPSVLSVFKFLGK